MHQWQICIFGHVYFYLMLMKGKKKCEKYGLLEFFTHDWILRARTVDTSSQVPSQSVQFVSVVLLFVLYLPVPHALYSSLTIRLFVQIFFAVVQLIQILFFQALE